MAISGAGASVEYGVPATIALTEVIEQSICADPWMQSVSGDTAFQEIKNGLSAYRSVPCSPPRSTNGRLNSALFLPAMDHGDLEK